jgi:hypothetical protein
MCSRRFRIENESLDDDRLALLAIGAIGSFIEMCQPAKQ